jgi:hypothetical protein
LNASHLGVGGPSGFTPAPVGKLGLRFDRNEFETNGRLKITEIITLSPASVDGVKIAAGVNLDELLENKTNRRVVLSVSASSDGANKREVIVKPVTTNAEKNLLYRQWVEHNRAYVAKISDGKIGYVHLPDMGQGSPALHRPRRREPGKRCGGHRHSQQQWRIHKSVCDRRAVAARLSHDA